MLRLITGLSAVLIMAAPAVAGELDAEFTGKASPATVSKITPASPNAMPAMQQPSADKAMASEMDDESPTQARSGWGGFHHHHGFHHHGFHHHHHHWGWGGGFGWGGYYGYRPWGWGYGWRRPWYWGGPYASLGFGYPYYSYPYYDYGYYYPASSYYSVYTF